MKVCTIFICSITKITLVILHVMNLRMYVHIYQPYMEHQ